MSQSDLNLPPHGKAPLADTNPPAPCNGCGTLTARKELAELGARCRSCYELYRAAQQPPMYAGTKRPTLAQREMLEAVEQHQRRGRPDETGGAS